MLKFRAIFWIILITAIVLEQPSFSQVIDLKTISLQETHAGKFQNIALRNHNLTQTLYRFSNEKQSKPKRFYFQSGLHGDEKIPVEFLFWVMERIKNKEGNLYKWMTNAEDAIQIDFLPIANPLGFAANKRNNMRGVDLNRNFPILFGNSREYPGAYPASEIETQNIMNWTQKQNYTLSVDIHGYANYVVVPSNLNDPLDSLKQLRDSILKHLPKIGEYNLTTPQEINHGGSFEDWSFWQAQTPAFCLELLKNTEEKNFEAYESFLLAILQEQDLKSKNKFIYKPFMFHPVSKLAH